MHEPTASGLFSPPALVYFGMGLMIARILLEREILRGITWLKWLQFLVRAGSIVLLWPLVLFLEKFEHWVKSPTEGSAHDDAKH